MEIVPAQANDLPHLFALLEASFLPTAGIAAHLSTTLLARDGGQLVGSAVLELYGKDALLRSVAVKASWRGQGLGERLTQTALSLAHQKSVRQVYLLTETAQDYFLRLGFRPIARSAVSPTIHASVEWTHACPASAQAMVFQIEEE